MLNANKLNKMITYSIAIHTFKTDITPYGINSMNIIFIQRMYICIYSRLVLRSVGTATLV